MPPQQAQREGAHHVCDRDDLFEKSVSRAGGENRPSRGHNPSPLDA